MFIKTWPNSASRCSVDLAATILTLTGCPGRFASNATIGQVISHGSMRWSARIPPFAPGLSIYWSSNHSWEMTRWGKCKTTMKSLGQLNWCCHRVKILPLTICGPSPWMVDSIGPCDRPSICRTRFWCEGMAVSSCWWCPSLGATSLLTRMPAHWQPI